MVRRVERYSRLSRRALLISRGNPGVLVQRPIGATPLGLAVLALLAVLLPAFSKTREQALPV